MQKQIKRFMLVVPNNRWFGKQPWHMFTPAVVLLFPILKNYGVTVEVLEANLDNLTPEQVKERIKIFKPHIYGISNLSIEYWKAAHLMAQLAKEVDRDITVIMGGVHATTLPERVVEDKNVDYLILGEGEIRLPKFLDIIQEDKPDFTQMEGVAFRENGKVVVQPNKDFVWDLDVFPLPDYSWLDWKKVFNYKRRGKIGITPRRTPCATMITTRGCPYKCCFCANRLISGPKVRSRSAENVLKEIDMLVKNYGVRELLFMDDEMFGDRQRAIDILQGIKKRNYDLLWRCNNLASWLLDDELLHLMKETGCYQIIISPETGSKRVLNEILNNPLKQFKAKEIADKAKALGMEVEADFIFGLPGETWEEIRQTFKFAEDLNVDSVKFAIAVPYPGTPLYEMAKKQNCLPKDFDFYNEKYLGFARGVITTEEFTPQELGMIRFLEWDRINFSTLEKRKKWAEMNNLTLEELEDFRRKSRRNVGVYIIDE